jgi:hypothetical protein
MNYLPVTIELVDSHVMSRFQKLTSVPETGDGCWMWTGAKQRGYGQFTLRWFKNSQGKWRSQTVRAHRLMWMIANQDDIPEGLTIEHTCRNKSCLNPLHLELLDRGENARRGNTLKVCKSGLHSMTGSNVIRRPSQPSTKGECRACANSRRRK